MVSQTSNPALRRLPFLLPGILALLTGLWGGLLRIPLNVPLPVQHANWITHHGSLMVCGFLGTLIGVERAVGSGQRWSWFAPILTGGGALLCLGGAETTSVLGLFLLGSTVFAGVNLYIAWRHRMFFTALMAFAAIAWLIGNALMFVGISTSKVVWWWATFLGWTIVAERLELTRLIKVPKYARPCLFVILVTQFSGLLLIQLAGRLGDQVIGFTFIGQALWLLRFDLARKNIKLSGLPKYTGICLLLGYCWLALSGTLLVGLAPLLNGSTYDAVVHAYYMGFVFAMIFGHAPIIFPAVLKVRVVFTNRFYLHLALLQVTLAMRVAADLLGVAELRGLAAVGNVTVIVIFLLNTVVAVISGHSQSMSHLRD